MLLQWEAEPQTHRRLYLRRLLAYDLALSVKVSLLLCSSEVRRSQRVEETSAKIRIAALFMLCSLRDERTVRCILKVLAAFTQEYFGRNVYHRNNKTHSSYSELENGLQQSTRTRRQATSSSKPHIRHACVVFKNNLNKSPASVSTQFRDDCGPVSHLCSHCSTGWVKCRSHEEIKGELHSFILLHFFPLGVESDWHVSQQLWAAKNSCPSVCVLFEKKSKKTIHVMLRCETDGFTEIHFYSLRKAHLLLIIMIMLLLILVQNP